jgi:hypothetical protein
MTDLTGHVRTKLVDRISRIIDDHQATSSGPGSGVACRCGARTSDHSRHVADQIVEELGLKPESIDEVKQRIRYASALLDWELTRFEGAQC